MAAAHSCVAEVDIEDLYPAVLNHATQSQYVREIGAKYFGAEKVKSADLPLTASEDFSYFLEEKPGCFFMLGTKQKGQNYCLHTSYYDYNDSMIGSGGYMFVRIVEERLGVKIIQE